MDNEKIDLFPLIIKTSVTHTVSYFVAGVAALTLLNYGETMGAGDSIFKPITDPMVMAGPLFQPIRGLIFALAFYPIRNTLFGNKLGWIYIWWLLVALGVLSTFGPAPGSIEAMIYTNLELSFSTYVEVVTQAFIFAFILFYWMNNKEKKWLNWVMGIAFTLTMLLPTLGLLIEQ